MLQGHFSWQAQNLLMLERGFSCQAHHLVMLEPHTLWQARRWSVSPGAPRNVNDFSILFICDADQSWQSFFLAGATFGDVGMSLFVASATFGYVRVLLSVAGASFCDVGVWLLMAGATCGDVRMSCFVAGATFGDVGMSLVTASHLCVSPHLSTPHHITWLFASPPTHHGSTTSHHHQKGHHQTGRPKAGAHKNLCLPSHWLVALLTFYRQILSLVYSFFPFETSAPGFPFSTCKYTIDYKLQTSSIHYPAFCPSRSHHDPRSKG